MKSLYVVAVGLIVFTVAGCSSTPEQASNEAQGTAAYQEFSVRSGNELAAEDPILHETKKIILIEISEKGRVRKHVGFVDRRYSELKPDAISFVLDRTHEERGFILPSGSVFAVRTFPDGSWKLDELGMMGFDLGVREILRVAGAVEYEPIE